MKKTLLAEHFDSASSDSEDGGALLKDRPSEGFKVNQDYAKKFEYNKKREEKQRLAEKLGKDTRKRKRGDDDDGPASASDDSTSESEDEGELDTEALDAEMLATIAAIRKKDPRVYDPAAKFYTSIDETGEEQSKPKKEKAMNLQAYHRQNLLNGMNGAGDDDEDAAPLTYNQEQEQLRRDTVKQMHAATEGASPDAEADANDDFLIAKAGPEKKKKKKKKTKSEPVLDVDNAEKDPETFLSNFMSSRAWASHTDDRNLVPFESDDEDEDRRADEFEEAYNMRFEAPEKSNEKLKSHARDMAARYSVRRDEANPRQKRRETEKVKREADKLQVKEEKARLRKLRLEEVEDKVKRIKKAAGLRSEDLLPEDWSRFVDDDWDDAQWEEEMRKRFGQDYYAEEDVDSDQEATAGGKRKPKKPKFDDDIDIKDIVPDYQDEDEQPEFSLSDDDDLDNGTPVETEPKPNKTLKKQAAISTKQSARKERRLIEQLVDDQLQYDLNRAIPTTSKHETKSTPSGFRYRETSPKSFGLSSRDILLADDSALNQYAGLKKLAAFREPDKKKKDQKHLGKKARLRKWRADTFGDEAGVESRDLVGPAGKEMGRIAGTGVDEGDVDMEHGGVSVVEGSRKKKRRRKNKQKTGDMEV